MRSGSWPNACATGEQDAAAARVLAGGADRDVDEIRASRQAATSSLDAVRDDLADLRGRVDDGFAGLRGGLDASAAGQQQIVALLNTLISRQADQPSDE